MQRSVLFCFVFFPYFLQASFCLSVLKLLLKTRRDFYPQRGQREDFHDGDVRFGAGGRGWGCGEEQEQRHTKAGGCLGGWAAEPQQDGQQGQDRQFTGTSPCLAANLIPWLAELE